MLLVAFGNPAVAAPPDAPVLVSPADGAGDVDVDPQLVVAVSDPDGDAVTVRFEGRAYADPGPDFSIVVLPDTQYYTCACNGADTATFRAQTEWIAANTGALDVAYVAHVGDC